jgi:GTP cyclohydrolase II
MRVHQMKRTQRLVLHFNERDHTVRVREYWSAFDASAGLKDLRLDWKMATGIQFFAIEHKRVFGVQLGTDGKPTGELSKAYTFNLQELKAPIIEAVTRAGWTWQPVTWNAPAAFRWLTE